MEKNTPYWKKRYSLILDMNTQSINNRIKSLDGLKAIMLFLIFCWHTPTNPNQPFGEPVVDFGARSCEVLFVASGFLVGYNYFGRYMTISIKQSWNYISSKLSKVLPLHLITFVIIAIYLIQNDSSLLNISTLYKAVINLLLLQSWTSDPFSFNSVMWFISTLMYCYLLTPLMMSILKKPYKVSVITFIFCTILRIILELFGINITPITFHVSPLIRCLEFFMGMLMVPSFYKIKDTLDKSNSMMISSLIELLVSAIYIFLIISMQGKWIRGYYVLASCLLVFVYALNVGYFSKILSLKPFVLFSRIQMEFYILHQVVIRTLDPLLGKIIHSVFLESAVLFFIIIILSVLYNLLLKKKCSLFIEKLLNGLS